MSYRHRERRDDFSGGYNSRDKDVHLQDTESPDMRNIMIGKRGGIEPRKGISMFSEEPVASAPMDDGAYPPVTSLFEHVNAGGQSHVLAFAGRELKRANASGGWTLVQDNLLFNSSLCFVTHPIINRTIFVNGYNGYWITNGITCEEMIPYTPTHEEEVEIGESVLPENPTIITYYGNRLWVAGMVAHRTRVYFNVDDIIGNIQYNYFTHWSWINIPSIRGEQITGLFPFRDSLLVFTPTTIKAITETAPVTFEGGFAYTPPSYRMDEVSGSAGTVSQRSIHLMQGKLIFLGTDGVYVYDGAQPPFKVSQRVDPDFANMNQDYWHRACGAVWSDKYLISVPV